MSATGSVRGHAGFLVEPAELFRLLDGDLGWLAISPAWFDDPARNRIVECEGLAVALLRPAGDGWEVAALACIGVAHGVHPRYAALTARIAALRERVLGPTPAGPCPRCDGSGWLEFESDEARRVRALARSFGMWRGIVDPHPRVATREETILALDVFLGEASLAGLRGDPRRPSTGGKDGGD